MIELWCVEWADGPVPRPIEDWQPTEKAARESARRHRNAGHHVIRVTGPHQHCVPA